VPALNGISRVAAFEGPTVPLLALYVTIGAAGVTPVEVVVAVDDCDPRFATAENLYGVPFVKPVRTHDVAGDVTVHVLAGFNTTPEASRAVTVNEVGDSPTAAATVIVARAFPATAEIVGGLSGVVPATIFEVRPVFPLSARIATW
jgi:hypothetical protein